MKPVHLYLTIIFTLISAFIIFIFSPVSELYSEGFNWVVPVLGWVVTCVCSVCIIMALSLNKKEK